VNSSDNHATESYAGLLIECFIPPVIHNGFTFEPHQQNTLVRFENAAPHRMLGFYIRDSGGLKLHLPTVEQTTGVKFEGEKAFFKKPEGLRVLTPDLETVYARTYNCIVVNHLQVGRCSCSKLCYSIFHTSAANDTSSRTPL
jgi:siderophore synthetase component